MSRPTRVQPAKPSFSAANMELQIEPETLHKKAMENLQELILKIAQTHPNKRLTESSKSLVQDHLTDLFSKYRAPDHPPYHKMIERAIRELNEKGGSRMDSISKFLKKQHDNLPWAHVLLLKQHLIQLCESGDIVLTRADTYMLSGVNPSKNASTNGKRNRLMKDWSSDCGMEENRQCKKQVLEKEKLHQETDSSQTMKFDIWAPRK